MAEKEKVVPGFGLTLGFTVFYLSLLILLPISTIFIRSATLDPSFFLTTIASERVLASFKVSFLTAFSAALINSIFGFIIAWVLVRYRFPGRRIFDAFVDLPFALPTAVAGIALTAIYAPNGFIGRYLSSAGLPVAFTPLGIFVALLFVGLPFVVRTLQPVIEDIEVEIEEASATMGASRYRTFISILLPGLLPAMLTGFCLAFARGLGEYGSVVFISGNMPLKTEIVPLLIMTKLEQFDYAGATVLALSMLLVSFLMLFTVNYLQGFLRKR